MRETGIAEKEATSLRFELDFAFFDYFLTSLRMVAPSPYRPLNPAQAGMD
jgi:hypothetical protein